MKQLVGKEILNDPFMNKGTAFTYEERKKFGLTGLLPTVVRTLEEQVRIEYEKVSQYETDYEKNKYLMQIYDHHVDAHAAHHDGDNSCETEACGNRGTD